MQLGTFYTAILLLAINFSWAQYDSTYIYKDFNADGYSDTLLKFYDGGSGYGGYYIEIQNGATDATYAMETDACFCQIRQTLIFPKNLTEIENAPFLTAILSELLPPYRAKPDPSLSWMLAAELSNKQLESDSLFIQIINPKQSWIKGEMELPVNYYIEMKGDLLGLYYYEHTASGYAEIMNDEGVMVYYAQNHYGMEKDTLKLAAQNDTYKIYKTEHGIIAKKGNTYKWLFISDVTVTWAPEKLRWASIGKVRLVGKHILFEQHLTPHVYSPIHVINIETGKFGRFRALVDTSHDPFDPANESLLFELDNGEIEYSFEAIFESLNGH
ncbi:MAG: hypothetical protein GQ574_12375 [Crocinitomix sp.]|nr:hypothetical protein [Crocinitomix sp.]